MLEAPDKVASVEVPAGWEVVTEDSPALVTERCHGHGCGLELPHVGARAKVVGPVASATTQRSSIASHMSVGLATDS